MPDQEQPSSTVEEQRGGSQGQLRQDALVEKLVTDPSQHQPAIQLTGFLGKGAQAGDWRLYLTPRLNEYVEFSEQEVVHTQPLTQDQSPLGGTAVWLKAGTTLRHTQMVSRQVQADFLQGGIASGFMPGASPFMLRTMVGGEETGYACTRNYVCSINPHIPACQDATEACSIGCGYSRVIVDTLCV
jgi:hypothetical protein